MALPTAGVELVAEGLSSFLSGMGKADDAVQKFGTSGASSGKSFASGFGDIVTGALRQVGALAVNELAKAGKAVFEFGKDSVKVAGDFQAGMLQFQAVAGKSVDTAGLQQFHDLFIQIGKELPVSTSEVQQAAIEMIKGGIDPATVAAGGLRQNIQFAAAAMGGDLAKAAEISAKILGGWTSQSATAAEKADFLTHSTDLLTKAANASSVDVEGLSLGIFNAQGIAKTAGVSFDDLTTTLAEIAPRFASSSEAGNSLKNVISSLIPTTKNQTAMMIDLGLMTEEGSNKFYDAQGKFVGFQQASQLLQDSLRGLTQEQQQAALKTIFGNDAMNAAAALAELGAKGYDDMSAALQNANGVQANAALTQQGYNTALENAKGSVEALQITLGEKLLPVLTDLLNNTIAPAVNAFTDWSSAILGAEDPLSALVAEIDKFSPTLGTVVAAIGDFITTGGDLGAALDDISNGFDINLNPFIDGLKEALKIAGSVADGIGDLVASFKDGGAETQSLGKAMDDLGGIFRSYLKTVQDVLGGYLSIVQSVLPIVKQFWTEHGAEITAALKTAYDTIISIIRTAIELYDAIVPPVLHEIAAMISAHANDIQTVLSGAWQLISGIISGALDLIKGILTIALDAIHGDWSKAWEDIKTTLSNVVGDIEKAVTGLFEIVAGLFGTSLAKIGELWQHNWDMLVEIAMKIGDRMVAAGKYMIDGVLSGIKANAGAIYDYLAGIAQRAIDAFLAAIGAGSPAKEFMPAGEYIGQGVVAGMQQSLPLLDGVIDQMTLQLIDSVKKMTDDIRDEIDKSIATIKQQIKSAQGAIANLQISGFQSTASIDRQKLSNMDAVEELSQKQQAAAALQLQDAEEYARTINDPKQAAEYFKQRSDQIIELGKLTDQINATTDKKERDRLIARYQLVNAAQNEETKAADLQRQQGSQTQDLIAQLQQLLSASITGGGKSVGLPALLDNSVIAALSSLLGKLVAPPTVPYQGMGGGNNYSSSRTVNMPIYTNQSPTVLQDSAAILNASMP